MADKIEIEVDMQDDVAESPELEQDEAVDALAEAHAEIERLRREVATLRETSVRTLADFDNFRKRTEREGKEAKRYALAEPLREFLDVVDNLERALSAEARPEDLKMGVEMILRQMHELLRRFGAVAIHTVGEKFDPTVHEAVARQPDPEVTQPTVRLELQRGYRLHERLLRPAMVTVAVPAAPAPAPAEDAATPAEPAAAENPADE